MDWFIGNCFCVVRNFNLRPVCCNDTHSSLFFDSMLGITASELQREDQPQATMDYNELCFSLYAHEKVEPPSIKEKIQLSDLCFDKRIVFSIYFQNIVSGGKKPGSLFVVQLNPFTNEHIVDASVMNLVGDGVENVISKDNLKFLSAMPFTKSVDDIAKRQSFCNNERREVRINANISVDPSDYYGWAIKAFWAYLMVFETEYILSSPKDGVERFIVESDEELKKTGCWVSPADARLASDGWGKADINPYRKVRYYNKSAPGSIDGMKDYVDVVEYLGYPTDSIWHSAAKFGYLRGFTEKEYCGFVMFTFSKTTATARVYRLCVRKDVQDVAASSLIQSLCDFKDGIDSPKITAVKIQLKMTSRRNPQIWSPPCIDDNTYQYKKETTKRGAKYTIYTLRRPPLSDQEESNVNGEPDQCPCSIS